MTTQAVITSPEFFLFAEMLVRNFKIAFGTFLLFIAYTLIASLFHKGDVSAPDGKDD